jgi:hypothetical protein
MVIKIFTVFISFAFFLSSAFVFAQTETGNEARLVQRFSWSGGEYALQYEVVFERMENEVYIFHVREFTNALFIEVSLSPGSYRFQVIPYDVLDRPHEPSEWRYIDILQLEPVEIISEVINEVINETVIINEAVVKSEAEYIPEPESGFAPLGDLLLAFGAAWSPFSPIYGSDIGEGFSLAGLSLRISAVFLFPFDIYIGPELQTSFNIDEDISIMAGINLLALKWFPDERLAAGIRLGISYSILSAFNLKGQFVPIAGASLRFRITSNLLLETGFDFSHLFADFSKGYIHPWIGLGWQK